MADKKNREDLRENFYNGLRPNADHFAEVFESFINFEDDLKIKDKAVKFNNGLTVGEGPGSPEDGSVRWKDGRFEVWNTKINPPGWLTLGGSVWIPKNAGDIYYEGGKVGIGTKDPKAKLEVSGGDISGRGMMIFNFFRHIPQAQHDNEFFLKYGMTLVQSSNNEFRNLRSYLTPVYIPPGTLSLRGKISAIKNDVSATCKIKLGINEDSIESKNDFALSHTHADEFIHSDELVLEINKEINGWKTLEIKASWSGGVRICIQSIIVYI